MWIEIVNKSGETIGAVNSEGCDLIRIGPEGAAKRALIRNCSAQPAEVYETRISYLRLIEAITQSEAEGLKQLAEVVASAEEAKGDRAAPRIVLAIIVVFAVLFGAAKACVGQTPKPVLHKHSEVTAKVAPIEQSQVPNSSILDAKHASDDDTITKWTLLASEAITHNNWVTTTAFLFVDDGFNCYAGSLVDGICTVTIKFDVPLQVVCAPLSLDVDGKPIMKCSYAILHKKPIEHYDNWAK